MAVVEKKQLSLTDIESQTALELPARETLALVNVTIFDVLNNNTVTVQLPITAAANVCGTTVQLLQQQINQTGSASCTATAGSQL